MDILMVEGGWSRERDLSLRESQRIGATLVDLGHHVRRIDPMHELGRVIPEAEKADFVYLCINDGDGMLQAMMDRIPRPYQGSDSAAITLAKHKAASKMLFSHAGLPTPVWEFISGPPGPEWRSPLPFPLVAKANAGGSSIGVHIVSNPPELKAAMDDIFQSGDRVLLEQYISGQELTCGILGGMPLPPVLIIPSRPDGFFDNNCKYVPGMAEEICPAPISDVLTAAIQEMTRTANDAVGLTGFARADFIVRDGTPQIIEINSQPGMTQTSLLPKEAMAVGIDFQALVARLVALGLEAFQERHGHADARTAFTQPPPLLFRQSGRLG